MREIKFRAWHPEWDKMVYSNQPDEMFGKREFYPFEFGVGFSSYPKDDEWVLMQCTSLKDKGGKEIYEGDIVKDCAYEGKFYTVEFRMGAFCFKEIINMAWLAGAHDFVEVIGNIYENPELLTGKDK